MKILTAILIGFIIVVVNGNLFAQEQSKTDETMSHVERQIDEREIRKAEGIIEEAEGKLEIVKDGLLEQLVAMERDVDTDEFSVSGYLAQLEVPVLSMLEYYDGKFVVIDTFGKVERIKARAVRAADEEWVQMVDAVLEKVEALRGEIVRYMPYWNKEEGSLALTVDIFESRKMDEITMLRLNRSINNVNDKLSETENLVKAQFEMMMSDVISGRFDREGYLRPIAGHVQDTIESYEKEFNPALMEKINKIIDKAADSGDTDLERDADKALKEIGRLAGDIEKYIPFWNREEGKVAMTEDVFSPCAESVVSKIFNKPKYIEDLINLEENKLDYFLVGHAVKMWPKIKKGKKLYPWSSYKIVLRDALIMIRDGKTYDVEKVLSDAKKRFKRSGKQVDTLNLLYSYVLLINWHDKKGVKEGYEYLRKSWAKHKTADLAFVMIRAGLRLGELQEKELKKIIVNAPGGDLVTLGAMNDLLVYMYIKEDDYDEAFDWLINELRERQRGVWKHVSPVFKFIVLLQQREFQMIATDMKDRKGQVKSLYESLD